MLVRREEVEERQDAEVEEEDDNEKTRRGY